MADTGEDREIKRRAQANEAAAIRESKKLAETTKQHLAKGSPRKSVKRSARSKSPS